MRAQPSDEAWNNFLFNSDPSAYQQGSTKWAAALACDFMGLANNGGLNSFLTISNNVDPRDVGEALLLIGAKDAASQLKGILDGLGHPLGTSSERERWDLLERCWTEVLDEQDILTDEADRGLLAALQDHVAAEEPFYLGLNGSGTG